MQIKKYSWLIGAILKADFSTKKRIITNFFTAKKKYVPRSDVDNVLKCALCPNMCRFDCPVSKVEKSEVSSPAGKMRIAYLLETGKLEFSEDAINLMYKDADCDACKQWCPFDFSIGELLVDVRKDIVKKGFAPKSSLKIQERLKKEHTIYDHGITSIQMDPSKTSLKEDPEKKKVLYFAGCTTLNKRKEVADATVEILEKTGVNFATLPEEWCCGAPLHTLGFHDTFKEFAEHNLKEIKETGCDTILCSCPTCVYTFKKLYPKNRLKIEHTSQFLLKLIKENKIGHMEMKQEEEYVFHDPCVLSRKLNIYDEPREVLSNILKLNIKEPYFNKKDTRCCGLGGMIGITSPELSLKIAKNRSSELKEVCNSVVTACPACEIALKTDKIWDLSEVVLRGMKNGECKIKKEN